jgi:hypothetical protein
MKQQKTKIGVSGSFTNQLMSFATLKSGVEDLEDITTCQAFGLLTGLHLLMG